MANSAVRPFLVPKLSLEVPKLVPELHKVVKFTINF